MLLRRKLPLLFMTSLGLLAYALLDWNSTSMYFLGKNDRLKSSLERGFSNKSLEYSHHHGIGNYQKHSSENDDNIRFRSHSNELSSSGNSTKNLEVIVGKSQGAKKETKLNIKKIDEKVKHSEVDNVVSIISRLSKIKESSSIMSMVRDALNKLSQIPSLPPDLATKSKGSLLSTVVPPLARVTYSDTWHGYSLPIITCESKGRLGNVMGEYATIYALQQLYNVTVVINDVMRGRLRHFPFLSLPNLAGKYNKAEWKGVSKYGSLYNYAPIELAASGLFGPQRFAMREYAFEIQLFQKYKKDLKQEFTLSSDITMEVQEFFKSVAEKRRNKGYSDIVFIGFHVRRTDYAKHVKNMFGATLPEDSYYNRAMDYFRNKFHGRAVFIAASDDPTFIRKKIGKHSDVFFSPGTSAPLDMAMLSSCNHSIITLGSYGFWTGFLAGGEVVYPDTKFDKEYRFSRAMYEKIGLASFTPLPVN